MKVQKKVGTNMQNRYVKPQNVKEAMTIIQDLFNKYRHEPLTDELLRYHQNLTNRLQTDIYQAAQLEGNDFQTKQLAGMITAMQDWTRLKVAGRPFRGKMKNFKLVEQKHQKIKRVTRKGRAGHKYHVAHH